MTTATYRTAASDTFARFAAYIDELARGVSEGREIEARYHELSQLSRADLARRGLTRETIARAALTGC